MKRLVRLAFLHSLKVACFWLAGHDRSGGAGFRRILVIRPDHLGDMLFLTPALRRLRESYPACRITCLIGPWAGADPAKNRDVDEIVVCEFPGFTRRPKRSYIAPYIDLVRWAMKIRRGGYDAAIIFRFDFWWGSALAYLAGIPVRIGGSAAESRPFLSSVTVRKPGRHEVLRNLDMVTAPEQSDVPDLTWAGAPMVFELGPEARSHASQYLQNRSMGSGERPLVAIHPGSGSPLKLWPSERFSELADRLAHDHGAGVIVTGSAAEAELVNSVAKGITSPAVASSGEFTIEELAALFSRCAMVIGTDSGPLHLATAVGTPTVRLYGPSDPEEFGPWGDPSLHRTVPSTLTCVPCRRLDYCPKPGGLADCMPAIAVNEVYSAAEAVLARGREELPG